MQVQILEFAKQYGVTPMIVIGVLDDLGVAHDETSFDVDQEILELIAEAVKEKAVDADAIHLSPGKSTPRDLAAALGKPDTEVLTALIKEAKVMATLTTTLKPE